MPGRLGRLGNGPPRNNVLLFAAFILLLPWLVEAQQRSSIKQQSPPERRAADPHTFEATKVPPQVETPLTTSRRKNTISVENNNLNLDESAIALAESISAVELSPSSRRSSAATAGLASPHLARSLEDWEVEDFVLLATIDGRLWARDRKTGKERWHLEVENAMVETNHFRHNRSTVDEGYDSNSIDDYLWIVEPSRDGALYIYRHTGPNRGLVNTGLTIKNLVEESPFKNADPPVIYTGRKNTSMITVDAKTGNVLSWFGSDGGAVNQPENCPIPTGLIDADSGACSSNATLVLGRTEYVVNIRHVDGRAIAVLKYSEWTPNNYDQDLQRQYHTTLDNKYIYTSHDGGVMGFDHERSSTNDVGKLFRHKLPSPVVRVFDVARPWGIEKNDPELVVLPQPTPPSPSDDEVSESIRASRIFLNHTEDGSWFAMSGKSYPMAVQGPRPAPCSQNSWLQQAKWDDIYSLHRSEALVGIHSVETERQPMLTISGPLEDNGSDTSASELLPALAADLTLSQRARQLPKLAKDSLVSFISNPILILFLVGLLMTNQRQLRTWIGRIGHEKEALAHSGQSALTPESLGQKDLTVSLSGGVIELSKEVQGDGGVEKGTAEDLVPEVSADDQNAVELAQYGPPNNPDLVANPKKKARRGQRGGVKHRKGRQNSQDTSDPNDKAAPTVEDAVQNAKKLGEPTKLEPDIRTMPQDPAEVSGPVIRIGALEVNTEQLIGTGSNGTMVFQGHFDGREVAVKRMLIQFFDIASQETKLLRESDDHPNGK